MSAEEINKQQTTAALLQEKLAASGQQADFADPAAEESHAYGAVAGSLTPGAAAKTEGTHAAPVKRTAAAVRAEVAKIAGDVKNVLVKAVADMERFSGAGLNSGAGSSKYGSVSAFCVERAEQLNKLVEYIDAARCQPVSKGG